MSEMQELPTTITLDLDGLHDALSEIQMNMSKYVEKKNYILAESCRVNAEKLRKDLDEKKVQDLQKRQRKETKELRKALKSSVAANDALWDQKLFEKKALGEITIQELVERHEKQLDQYEEQLEEEIPFKWKESSECLDLRKKEEYMAKQQRYMEAHWAQQKVKEMEKLQKEAWEKERFTRIEIGINLFKQRQAVEMLALKKRIQAIEDGLMLEKTINQAKVALKHTIIEKEIKSQNKKEILATKGEFRTRANVISPMTKSRLLNLTR